MKPILLLGASGLLGRAFVAEMQLRDLTAIALNRAACDITSAAQVAAVLDQYAPATVINCCAYTKVDLAEVERLAALAGNADGVGILALACARRGIRLVHFSTDFVFDGRADRPYLPGDPVAPIGFYGESKLRGEQQLQTANPPGWMILRTSWLFGATGPCFPQVILNRARAGQPLKVVSDQIGSPTYAPDLAATTLDLLDAGATGIRHVTNGGRCSWFDFAAAILEEFGLKTDLQPVTTAQFASMRPGQAKRPAWSVMADPEMVTLLGRAQRPWRDALTSYAESLEPARVRTQIPFRTVVEL